MSNPHALCPALQRKIAGLVMQSYVANPDTELGLCSYVDSGVW